MPPYFFIYVLILVCIAFFFVRHFVIRKNSLPAQLFVKGLQAENNGNYQEAALTYESALAAIKKASFNRLLQKKIVEKIKVLHMVIAYQNNQSFIHTNKTR